MTKKYKLTSESKEVWGVKLYRIEAVSDFGSVSKGERGGFVEKEENLSQEGDAWVFGDARVFGDAQVFGNARVLGNAQVFGNARVFGDAQVFGNARVFGDAQVFGNAQVFGDAQVLGNAQVYKNEKLIGGYFYHTKQKSEKVEVMKNDDSYETLCSNPKYEKGEKEMDLSGQEVEVKIAGKTYKAIIK